MECGCADQECEHKKQTKRLYHYAFSNFKGTQEDYQKEAQQRKEMNEWIEIYDMLEKEDKDK